MRKPRQSTGRTQGLEGDVKENQASYQVKEHERRYKEIRARIPTVPAVPEDREQEITRNSGET